MYGRRGNENKNWIGVEACWQLYSDEPWDHLVSITPEELGTHALILGATGSGKTVLMQHLIAQDLENGHSICQLDLRGDQIRSTLELCAGRVDPSKILVLDLREKARPFGFNPLYGAGEPYFRALNVLSVIKEQSASWGVQLEETLRNALLVLAEAGHAITELEPFFFNAAFREECLGTVSDEQLANYWERYDELSAERQAALASPVLNKVAPLLATPTLRTLLGHSSPIDLGRHLNIPGSVLLVSLAVDELHGSGRVVGSLLLSAICREIFARVPIAESQRNPVRLYVDEFENFSMDDFESIFAEGRRFKLSTVLAHQTLAQLDSRSRSLILGNVGVKCIFRLGHEDGATLGRDIFRDASFYDFGELPTGYCVLWRKERGDIEVEVSEPLVRDVGRLSLAAHELLQAVYRRAPKHQPRALPTSLPEPPEREELPSQPQAQRPARRLPPPSLEDWL
jgi:hypothetical protein